MRGLILLLASAALLAPGVALADTTPVTLTANAPWTLDQFADALRAASHRPVLVGISAPNQFLRDDQGHRIKVQWNGPVADLLARVAPRFGIRWAEEGDAILLFDTDAARPKVEPPKVRTVALAPSTPPKPVTAAAASVVSQPRPEATPAPAPAATPEVAATVAAAPVVRQAIANAASAPIPAAPKVVVPSAPSPQGAPIIVAASGPLTARSRAATIPAPASAAGYEGERTSLNLAPVAPAPRVLDVARLVAEAQAERPAPARPLGRTEAARDGSGARALDPKEAYGVELANRWKASPDKPRQGEDGTVKYLFGATLPTLVCSPLEVCAVQLQQGETVNDVHAGDTARWGIKPATSGSGDAATTLVVVKPSEAGLTTNLFITTDRRVYSIKLVSAARSWMPLLAFDYPDDVQREWAAIRKRKDQADARERQAVLPTTASGEAGLANLDFGFRLSGDRPAWAPTRVYSDGEKTFIQFPSARFASEAPALVELGRGGASDTEMVNYRVIGDRYVVDHVIDRAALVSGVGRGQTRVLIGHAADAR